MLWGVSWKPLTSWPMKLGWKQPFQNGWVPIMSIHRVRQTAANPPDFMLGSVAKSVQDFFCQSPPRVPTRVRPAPLRCGRPEEPEKQCIPESPARILHLSQHGTEDFECGSVVESVQDFHCYCPPLVQARTMRQEHLQLYRNAESLNSHCLLSCLFR